MSEPMHFVSLGAGVQSSTVVLKAALGEITPMPVAAIFADTGAEPKRVMEYLAWLETQLPFPVIRVMHKEGLRQNIIQAIDGGRLNGAGRIGRLLLRLVERDPSVVIAAVNDLAGPPLIAHLLRHDSIHGPHPTPVAAHDDGAIEAGGRRIPLSREPAPEAIPWDGAGVVVVVEATGHFARRELAGRHLGRGVRRVLVTAACADADATVVLGPHDGLLGDRAQVAATASCTTHAAALPLWRLDEWYGVFAAEMLTVHCTTGSQMTIDGPHADPRAGSFAGGGNGRGRRAFRSCGTSYDR